MIRQIKSAALKGTQLEQKAWENRCVFSSDFKFVKDGADLMWSGRLFHRFGAATVRGPVWGLSRSSWVADLSSLTGVCMKRSSDK